ncbi:MAG: hypothetical protein UCJ13_05070 [Bacteroidaceae bacterium]|nr:hypothetical protein [Bacteroidaceae bacterium]
MSYQSIDQIQRALADTSFSNRLDKKKAAGRALGLLLELITFYLLKANGLEHNIAIERSVLEYANSEIGHNVEFTLHSGKTLKVIQAENHRLTAKKIQQKLEPEYQNFILKNEVPIKNDTIRNASVVLESQDASRMIVAYPDASSESAEVHELRTLPFAMFECKRVGIEEGMKKGPQTIEKAKQGAYVARTASKLQKIRRSDGVQMGVLERDDGTFQIDEYDSMLEHITQQRALLDGVVVTVGVISDHGNWFSAQKQNKETKVLAESYDWLLFLTDEGLSEFIKDTLDGGDPSMSECRNAFIASTRKEQKFTKKELSKKADEELTKYFIKNNDKILQWFNVITPYEGRIENLFEQLIQLSKREEI